MKLRETISWLMGTLQRSLFPYFEECSGTPLTEKQKQLIQILEIVQVEKSVPKTATHQWMGRKVLEREAIARAFVAKIGERGRKVILVEILPEIAAEADADTKAYFGMKFKQNNVQVYTGTELILIAGKTATVRQGQEEIAVNVDVLIFAVGAKPDNRLQEELVSSGRSVVKAGDCIQPRNILESVREGFEAGNKID